MNTIIYSTDFEPITAVDLPLYFIESAEKNGKAILVMKKSETENMSVLISCHKITWVDGTTKSVLVTEDEEAALMMKPEWLVGQKALVNAYRRTLNILTNKLKKLRPED